MGAWHRPKLSSFPGDAIDFLDLLGSHLPFPHYYCYCHYYHSTYEMHVHTVHFYVKVHTNAVLHFLAWLFSFLFLGFFLNLECGENKS